MRQANSTNVDGSSSVNTAGARAAKGGDAALAATRELRPVQLRRMPTELVLTTRMPPVRHGNKPGSGVRPLSDSTPEFDRRPTAQFQRQPEQATRGYAADSGASLREAAARAHLDLQRAANAHHATAAADYSVAHGQRATGESEHVAHDAQVSAAADYAAAAYHSAPQRIATPRGQTPVHQPVAAHHSPASNYAQPPQPRRSPAAHSSSVPAIAGESLARLHHQLATALDNARRSEQRAMEAELRASWAERFVPQMQDHDIERLALRRHQRMRWCKRVLQISFVGLAIGGYVSLLMPVRERVIAQNAVIEKLTTVQRQLRDEKRELLERIEDLNPPSGEPGASKSSGR